MSYKLLIITLLIISPILGLAQGMSSDDLFQQARKSAFDNKDYKTAIALCKEALNKSPGYADIRIFLGRLYTWSHQPDSARLQLGMVLKDHPDNEDASFASASLEYWNDNPAKSLVYLQQGLSFHPASNDLLLLKAKVLNSLKKYSEANAVVDSLLKKNSGNTEARALAARIKDNSSKNKIGVAYDFVYFDKQFNNPWHLASVDYTRQTDLGSVAVRLNYANRFNTNGAQLEFEAYPHLSKTFYVYAEGGYSSKIGVFPNYRAGFSLYANLPASFEAEAGFRFISFNGPTWIYTASLGKYYKNFWFNFRTYLTPSYNEISQSFSLNTRYYWGGADDYLSFSVGTGISPDNPGNNVLLNSSNPYKLKSDNVSAGYRRTFKLLNVMYINLSLVNQEYRPQTRGNQFDAGIGYIRRF